jgi:hypothetical protein
MYCAYHSKSNTFRNNDRTKIPRQPIKKHYGKEKRTLGLFLVGYRNYFCAKISAKSAEI